MKYEALESVCFVNASIDGIDIASFLQNNLRLTTFKFWYSAAEIDSLQGWDICQYIMLLNLINHMEALGFC